MATEKRRLIDANELPLGKFVEPRTEWHQGWNDALDAAMSQAPTVDAVEVVHGRFVDAECSVCRWFGNIVETRHYNYCPNCGAKMDGERRTDG
mgnify:CR=1 FL=1